MITKANALSERLLDYGVKIVKVSQQLYKEMPGKIIAYQLIRSGTSAGANYEEACGAESKADFIHKLQIVLKEMRESLYWLKLIEKTSILKDWNIFTDLMIETKELGNIIAKSIITAKKAKT